MKQYLLLSATVLTVIVVCLSACKKKDSNDSPNPGVINLNLGNDTTLMEGDTLLLDAGHPGSTFLWSDGTTGSTLQVDTTGTYWVRVTKGNDIGSDTIHVYLAYKLAKIETDFGNMLIWLYPQTPLHRANFIKLVSEQFYDSLIFHRVVDNFVIQGGDPTGTGYGGPGYTIPAEFRSAITHINGAVGAARQADNVNPEKASNGSQFYIVDNVNGTHSLDGNYTVFGLVIDGISTVDAISQVPVNPGNNRPIDNVYMKKVTIVNYTAAQLITNFGFTIPH